MNELLQVAANAWDTVWPFLLFLFGLGVVVFVHELGHFVMARWVGIRVETFALGLGPRLFGLRRKGTDYCVRLIPFGGYVKMTGQDDLGAAEDSSGDTGSFMNKTVGQRLLVVSSGVVMNLIFAVVVFVVIGLVGIEFVAPIVGDVVPDYPAAKAAITWHDVAGTGQPARSVGLRGGDRILSIDGRSIDRFARISTVALLGQPDDTYRMVFERVVDGTTRVGTAEMGLQFGDSPTGEKGSRVLKFGLASAFTLTFAEDKDLRTRGPFGPGDRIVEIAGQPAETSWQLRRIEKTLDGSRVPGEAAVAGGGLQIVLVQPRLDMWAEGYRLVFLADGSLLRVTDEEPVDGEGAESEAVRLTCTNGEQRVVTADEIVPNRLLDVLGMSPRLRVDAVSVDSPADRAGVMPGDIVLSYGRQSLPTFSQFRRVNEDYAGQAVDLVVQRRDEVVPLSVEPTVKDGQPIIGITLEPDQDHLVVADVRATSSAARAGVKAGSLLAAVNGRPAATWPDLVRALTAADDGPVTISGRLADEAFSADLGELSDDVFRPDEYSYRLFPGRLFEPLLTRVRVHNPLRAIVWGGREMLYYASVAYGSLRAMVTGTVGWQEVQGPVGMGQQAVKVARREGVLRFAYFMSFISVLLAVFNFLPLPVVDGGLAVLLIIEKVRGRPLNARITNVIQIVGVILLVGLFLIVTGRDIWRIIKDYL